MCHRVVFVWLSACLYSNHFVYFLPLAWDLPRELFVHYWISKCPYYVEFTSSIKVCLECREFSKSSLFCVNVTVTFNASCVYCIVCMGSVVNRTCVVLFVLHPATHRTHATQRRPYQYYAEWGCQCVYTYVHRARC